MTQYDSLVEKQRLLIEAEEWAEGTSGIHCHSISSMWYDNRPKDTANGKSVMDITYNSGLIERRLDSGKTIYFGEKLTGDALIQEYLRKRADVRKKEKWETLS
jgi:hypothetical protein